MASCLCPLYVRAQRRESTQYREQLCHQRLAAREKLPFCLGRGPWRQVILGGRGIEFRIAAEQPLRLGLAEARERRRFEIGRAHVGRFDQGLDVSGECGGQAEMQMDRSAQPLLHRLVTALYVPPYPALYRVYKAPYSDSGASCSIAASRTRRSMRGERVRSTSSTSSVCCATEKICAPWVCQFQRATRARPCAMSATSMSSGEGSSRSSRRPDSMRCQARAAFFAGGCLVVIWLCACVWVCRRWRGNGR